MDENRKNKSTEENKSKQSIKPGSNRNLAKGMYFGMLIGSAFMFFSMAMGHIAIGMFGLLFGMLFGVAFGAVLDKKQKKEADNDKIREDNGEE